MVVANDTRTEACARVGDAARLIEAGALHLGIELGSTRIKAVLIDDNGTEIGTGTHEWESQYVQGSWTYSLDAVWGGIQDCYGHLVREVHERFGAYLTRIASVGVSAMMHGYLVFDANGNQLVPFRTWRNTYTERAAALLSNAFDLNIPLRWSVSHLLHAVMNKEEHVPQINFLTTLSGYVHWKLTGRKVVGVGDASGIFPLAATGRTFEENLLDRFGRLDEVRGVPWSLPDILPEVLHAGQMAGVLTAEGAALLDPSKALQPGAVAAPSEGDAGTGMTATHAIAPRTGNVSAGTSAFAMVVLEKPISGVRGEIDLVATPTGAPVAMIHTNNCTGDLNAWLGLFSRFAELNGRAVSADELYATLFGAGARGDADAGGVITYNYISGEHQTGVPSGRPLLVREQEAQFTLENFMRAQLYGAFGALAAGMDVLLNEEGVQLDVLYAHGGLFRTREIAQQILADALNTPVAVGASAGEGGAWGMALLAAYTALASTVSSPPTLNEFLKKQIFVEQDREVLEPDVEGAAGYAAWLATYRDGLPVERLAGDLLA